MPRVTFVQPDGSARTVEGRVGRSLMETAVHASIPGVVGECGGSMACATCHVYVDGAWAGSLPPVTEMESAMLDGAAAERRQTSRLSCQIRLTDALEGLVVQTPDSQY